METAKLLFSSPLLPTLAPSFSLEYLLTPFCPSLGASLIAFDSSSILFMHPERFNPPFTLAHSSSPALFGSPPSFFIGTLHSFGLLAAHSFSYTKLLKEHIQHLFPTHGPARRDPPGRLGCHSQFLRRFIHLHRPIFRARG